MDWISAWCRSSRRLDGCTAIVTGSNTGIGKETARDLYARGARVIMACRNLSKAESAKRDIETCKLEGQGSLVVEELDLASSKSVRNFVSRVLKNEDHINLLVNNGGIMLHPKMNTEDGFEVHMGTNHLGHALLTLLLLPRITASSPARIVFVSSYAHNCFRMDLDDLHFQTKPYNTFKAYAWSKAANVMFAQALSKKIKEHGIEGVTTYSLHPGAIHTDLGRHSSLISAIRNNRWLLYLFGWLVKSPRCGAQTTIYCSVDEACSEESGLYYSNCAVTKPAKFCEDETLINKLWEVTIRDLKLNEYNPFDTSQK